MIKARDRRDQSAMALFKSRSSPLLALAASLCIPVPPQVAFVERDAHLRRVHFIPALIGPVHGVLRRGVVRILQRIVEQRRHDHLAAARDALRRLELVVQSAS